MEALNQFMSSAVARIVRPAPLSAEKVLFAWRMSVGAAVARVSRINLDDDGTLVATLEDGRWRPELDRSSRIILERLQQLLGGDVVNHFQLISPAAPLLRRRTRKSPVRRTP